MAKTLAEIAKTVQDTLRKGVILKYAEESVVLKHLEIFDILGMAYTYNREDELPGVAFRGVNENFTESTGLINPVTEALRIMGGEVRCDKFLKATSSEDPMAAEISRKVSAMSKFFDGKFFNGDDASDAREFDGLKVRITGDQLIAMGANGAVLTTAKLDELMDAVIGGPSVLFMNKGTRRKLSALAVSACEWILDDFGRQVLHYNGVPVECPEEDNLGTAILTQTEVKGSSGAVCSSIYAVRMGTEDKTHVQGIQNGAPRIYARRDMGTYELQDVEWYVAMAAHHGKSAARLEGIKLA